MRSGSVFGRCDAWPASDFRVGFLRPIPVCVPACISASIAVRVSVCIGLCSGLRLGPRFGVNSSARSGPTSFLPVKLRFGACCGKRRRGEKWGGAFAAQGLSKKRPPPGGEAVLCVEAPESAGCTSRAVTQALLSALVDQLLHEGPCGKRSGGRTGRTGQLAYGRCSVEADGKALAEDGSEVPGGILRHGEEVDLGIPRDGVMGRLVPFGPLLDENRTQYRVV